jgi:hypothetical protein
VLAHGVAADVLASRQGPERRSTPAVDEAVSAAVEVHVSADATDASQSLDVETPPSTDVQPSPRVRFVEPVEDAHVEPPEVRV